MPQRSIRYGETTKLWTISFIGISASGVAAMHGFNTFTDIDFQPIHYSLPVYAGFCIPSFMIGMQALDQLSEATGLKRRWQRKQAQRIIRQQRMKIVAPKRSIQLTLSGRKASNLFMRTVQLFDPGNPANDPDISSKVVNYDKWIDQKTEWPVFIPDRKKPVIIPDEWLLSFLKIVWERQHNFETTNFAFSRSYFCNQIRFCSQPEYRALAGISRPVVWGRGDGESGYLNCQPRLAIANLKALHPPGMPVQVF